MGRPAGFLPGRQLCEVVAYPRRSDVGGNVVLFGRKERGEERVAQGSLSVMADTGTGRNFFHDPTMIWMDGF